MPKKPTIAELQQQVADLQAELGNLTGDKPLSAQITERVLASNAEAKQDDDNPFAVQLDLDFSDEPENPFDIEVPDIEFADEFVADWVAPKDEPFVLKGDSGLTTEEIGDKIFGKRDPVVAEAMDSPWFDKSDLRNALDAVVKAKAALNQAAKILEGLLK